MYNVIKRDGKNVSLENVAYVDAGGVLKSELLEVLQGSYASLLQVAELGLVEVVLLNFGEAELNGSIAFLISGLLLNDRAGTGFDNGYGNNLAGLIENLGHADFLSDDCLFHLISSLKVIG